MTTIDHVWLDLHDRKTDFLRASSTETINGVGSWEVILRNTSGKYNSSFDVNDPYELVLPSGTLMTGRISGPAVTLTGKDLESNWDEYVTIKGCSNAEDLLFHGDFGREYPITSQRIDDVLNDIFNIRLKPSTPTSGSPIWYAPKALTPIVGAYEFREGGGFLTQLQELMRRADYIFYVDHSTFELHCGNPGFMAVPAPSAYVSIAGNASNNIIGDVEVVQRDGGKLYNYIKLYGKAPMFDGYTELNVTNLASTGWHTVITSDPLLNSASAIVGSFSQVATNKNPVFAPLTHVLSCPVFNYTSWDFSCGEIGIWAKYDNLAGAPGSPGIGIADAREFVLCTLKDVAGNTISYFGGADNLFGFDTTPSSRLYEGAWGFCTFPLGEKVGGVNTVIDNGNWEFLLGSTFDWTRVVELSFTCPGESASYPSHFYIDGISLPFAILSTYEDVPSQTTYRKRPYVDSWPHIRTQNAMDTAARILLRQSRHSSIRKIKFMVPGSTNLRYAGQTVTVDVPSLGLSGDICYLTSVHQIIEPHSDTAGGYGFDLVAELEAIPIFADSAIPGSGDHYDMGRLRIGPVSSAAQRVGRLGAGVR